ncbi:MAG: 1-deoxy-D-xylulose-5-phosphate synthase [Clostridiales bacterium]|jgi:1-deoxy-D-xylulose-5-phosphate synthase|nr:1-deoxy-D-xylulose-5-phosphate synthase [Clostridiales bacterium]
MNLLNKIQSPHDLKKLKFHELKKLCAEIRTFLIDSISKTGGHLASNLGVVELTVALHAVFDSPQDKIIWDVGHQSYVHKILTGRRERFFTLRRKDGLSGFPKGSESPYDAFDTGHASTSISAALGYCQARDLQNLAYHVAAVIGDGSLTGGLAYEAINNAGQSNTNILVILNDNQMSISENVGALSRYLNEIRTAPSYLGTKAGVNHILHRLPLLGRPLTRFIERAKEGVKYFLVPGAMFEELGLNYIGPVDGHNLKELIGVLRRVKQMSGPVLLHVFTKKGKGYDQAEEAPDVFHGVSSFHVDTGAPVAVKERDTYSGAFGQTIARLSDEIPLIAAITAAMPSGVGLDTFAQIHPERLFDVGIAESHAVTFAAGLAKGGMIPIFAVYASFLQRAYDQILHDVCLQNLHVVFAIDRAGVVGADGETHQGLYDLAFLSHMPNMTVLAPKNKRELIQMLEYAVSFDGPIAVRYPKGAASQTLAASNAPIEYGCSETIRQGRDFVLLAVGAMMDTAYEVTRRFEAEGGEPGLVNVRFVKPVDLELVKNLPQYSAVYVLEDHSIAGGFGAKLLEAMAREQIHVEYFHDFALPDRFIEQGTRAEIFAQYGMDAQSVYCHIKERVKI